MATIKVEYVNPFITSTVNTFSTMLSLNPTKKAISVKEDFNSTTDISGVIGMSGNACGNVVLGFPKRFALKAVQRFLGLKDEVKCVDADVTDAIGELANMIAGGAKKQLNEFGFNISITPPNIVVGKGHRVFTQTQAPALSILFDSEEGEFCLDVCLKTPD